MFCSGWENGLRNVMMTVKLQTGLQQILRYGINVVVFLSGICAGQSQCNDLSQELSHF